MAFLTSGYVDLAIGTTLRQALAPSTAAFNVYEGQARAAVQAAAQVAGYSLGNTSTNDMVRLLSLGQWYFFAAGNRKGIETPASIKESIDKLAEVRDGRWPIPGLSPSTRDGVGGVAFSSTTESATGGRAQYFSRTKMTTW